MLAGNNARLQAGEQGGGREELDPGVRQFNRQRQAIEPATDLGPQALNAAGYRTTGNRGANLFSKDTVRVILLNRFYLGELPDGEGGWIAGRHDPLIDADLFEAAQRAREANTNKPRRVPGLRSP
jgi:hypothetical protein